MTTNNVLPEYTGNNEFDRAQYLLQHAHTIVDRLIKTLEQRESEVVEEAWPVPDNAAD